MIFLQQIQIAKNQLMQKILNTDQVKQVDTATLKKFNISSLDLVDMAAMAFIKVFKSKNISAETSILILCGTGKNGADGLRIASKLYADYNQLSVLIYRSGRRESPEFKDALKLLKASETAIIIQYWDGGALPKIQGTILIDALLGIGFKKPLDGELLRLVQHVNSLKKRVFAVDIPTGMSSFGSIEDVNNILKAEEVITFHSPKIAFLFPESTEVMARFTVAKIPLDEDYINTLHTEYSLIDEEDIADIYKKRLEFSHKGTYGKALIIAGDTRTLGAALLCAEACLHTGAGLTSACIPEEFLLALTIRCPEVMFVNEKELEKRWNEFTAVGIGPGLGNRRQLLRKILTWEKKPLLLDADALNELAERPLEFSKLPKNTVITPHMKEFDRLFGASNSWWGRLQLAREKAHEHQVIIVLKNRYTFIILPNKNVRINPTGNPAMASGGMGDVLSGMITAFLAQGYLAEEAAVLGCYLHGKAGDLLASEGMGVIPASVLSAKVPFVLGQFS